MIANYQLVKDTLDYLAEHYTKQPSLADISTALEYSEQHLQKAFTQWIGISPKKFLQSLTLDRAKDMLKHQTILDTTLDLGLSAPSRLHDLFVSHQAMSPGEFRSGGADMKIDYGFHTTWFGEALFASCDRGLCGLSFVNEDHQSAIDALKARLPNAHYRHAENTNQWIADALNFPLAKPVELRLLLAGTPFQLQVWNALTQISINDRVNYQQIANAIDNPKASRAVGSAVGRNPISIFIPCHRVIRSDGQLGGYAWGLDRKLAIMGWEQSL